MLFLATAGLNAMTFYLVPWKRVAALEPGGRTPVSARVVAAVSLSMWIGVIIAGRLLTFYRPGPCGASGPGFLAECIPRTPRPAK